MGGPAGCPGAACDAAGEAGRAIQAVLGGGQSQSSLGRKMGGGLARESPE